MYASINRKEEPPRIFACESISITPIVKPIAVFLTIPIKELPRDGNAAIKACGKIISLYIAIGLIPIDKAASFCPLSTDNKPPLIVSAINADEFVASEIISVVLAGIPRINTKICGNPK